VNIAIILQYGHGTRTGGYVTGIDYINPAIKPVFEEMANAAWKEVNS
ncbi:MAG: HK97 gp10 family phage protein, partial [Phascolarctobacterium sp.]